MASHLRGLIFTGLCLAVASCIETAVGSVFLPGPSELDRLALSNPEARVDLSALVPQLDETGRRFFEVDDMRYSADAVEIDSAFTGTNWPGGLVYYQFNPAVTTTNRQAWRSAAATWSAVANVSFVESTGNGNYIYVQNSSGNNSYVGMIGGQQTMNLYNWGYQEVIAHEIGHALGAIHEQCRPDRGSYVTILYANIEAGQSDNFDIETSATSYGTYDFDSIMHYSSKAFSSNGQNTIVPLPAYASHLATMGHAQNLSTADGAGMAQRYGGSGGTHPPNDNFSARIAILNENGSVNGTSVGGTKEAAEPSHAGNIGGKSIWYSWTAPATGTVTIDTVQSGFDTLLGVYTGNSVGALTPVASNDDISTSILQSKVTFAATSGVSYRIAVDGYNAASGAVRLNWSLAGVVGPANNNFANRRSLSGAVVNTIGSSLGATKEAGEPNHASNTGGRSVWFNWIAPAGGTVTIDTRQSNFDTLLGVYKGTSVGALTLVAANDDSLATLQSSVSFNAVAGVGYRIAVDGYGGASGSIALHIQQAASFSNFNGDAKPDYVLYSPTTRQTVIWYLNNNLYAGGRFGPTLPTGWRFVSAADVDGNGTSDYVLFQPSTRQTAIWYLSGGVFIRSAYGPTLPSGYELAAAADFNADGKPDYLLFNATTRMTAVWFLDGNLHTGGGSAPTLPVNWRIADVADFDRDGHMDWVVYDLVSRRTVIWYMNGVSLVRSAFGPTLASGYQLAGAADFNGDTKPDYVLYNEVTRQTVLWYMNNNLFLNTVFGPTVAAGYTLVAP